MNFSKVLILVPTKHAVSHSSPIDLATISREVLQAHQQAAEG